MTDFDLATLQAAANADLRPKGSIPDEIPTGTAPADQAVAGYTMAVNLVTRAAELDCDADWRRRQRIYATEIARLQLEGGVVDPAVLDELDTERVRATLNTRYCTQLHATAQAGYERIFELIGPHEVATTRTQMIERTTATVDEINALTQRLIHEYRPGASVYDFLSARTLDTTVPQY